MDKEEQTLEEIITTAVETTAAAEAAFQFEPMKFVENLRYMGTGMLGIFVVIGIIIVATVIINKATGTKK